MNRNAKKSTGKSTSWEPVGKWYHAAVGEEGHYYHKQIIIPGILRFMDLEHVNEEPAILDLACGQGVLSRHLPPKARYVGIDISSTLIKEAKKLDPDSQHEYLVADVTKPLPLKSDRLFSHGVITLALQNIAKPEQVFANVYKHLKPHGKLILILNHPCFRIPRQSSWQVDNEKKIQYRRIDRYLSSLEIPIQAHPSKGKQSPNTVSFHHPISAYSRWLKENGFLIELFEEWCSDKQSTGSASKMENRSRSEIPLFLAILAQKV